MEHAQKSILVFISEITSGAQRVLLWRGIKRTGENLLTVNSQQIRSKEKEMINPLTDRIHQSPGGHLHEDKPKESEAPAWRHSVPVGNRRSLIIRMTVP